MSTGATNLVRKIFPRLSFKKNRPVTVPSAGSDMLGDAGQWRLLDMVYSDPSALWVNIFVVAGIGCLFFIRLQNPWLLLWSISGMVIAVFRLVDFYSFKHRRKTTAISTLRRRYTLLAWILGAQWGCGGLVLVLTPDPIIHFWVINPLTAIVASAIARNNPVRLAARGQIYFSLVPTLLCCLASSDIYIQAYSVLVFLYISSSVAIVDLLHSQTTQLLISHEKNSELLLKLGETNNQLRTANNQLELMATTDGLTGIGNRRYFDTKLASEWGRAIRSSGYLSLLIVDVDHFKVYNDANGHQAGDECLRQVAGAIAKALFRHEDFVSRYGGEEFAVVLPGTDAFGAIDTAERIRIAVQNLALPTRVGSSKAECLEVVTISIGAATTNNTLHGSDSRNLIAEADLKLYTAKKSGRNCVRGEMIELLPALADAN